MKKLQFLVYIIALATPIISHSRLIEIIAEDGTSLHVSDTETIQGFFDKCRKDLHCFSSYKHLALDFNDKLIKEGSTEAQRTLWSHSSWNSNKAMVASLQYPQARTNNKSIYQRLENTLIDVEAPNGRIKQCSLNESPAYFFRKCRNSGDCLNNSPMTLKFGGFEIKENTEAANRPFSSFTTNSGFAQARYR